MFKQLIVLAKTSHPEIEIINNKQKNNRKIKKKKKSNKAKNIRINVKKFKKKKPQIRKFQSYLFSTQPQLKKKKQKKHALLKHSYHSHLFSDSQTT